MKSRNWNWLTCCKFSFKAVICALVLIICLTTKIAFSVAVSMPVNSIAVITAETKLNLREKPQGKIIGKLPHGEYVVILSKIDRNGYYRIRVNQLAWSAMRMASISSLSVLELLNLNDRLSKARKKRKMFLGLTMMIGPYLRVLFLW